MICTIVIGSCVFVRGTFVRKEPDGRTVVRSGGELYIGTLISPEQETEKRSA